MAWQNQKVITLQCEFWWGRTTIEGHVLHLERLWKVDAIENNRRCVSDRAKVWLWLPRGADAVCIGHKSHTTVIGVR